MKKRLLNLINICIITSFFTACGGGGGSSTQTITFKPDVSQTDITSLGTAIDYSEYAWSINSTSLNTNYASTYNIDSDAHISLPSSTSTSKIKVAIIDQGFEFNHPDIYDKILEVKYITNTSLNSEYHGTTVAGIIASSSLGVAPDNVELILININFDTVQEAGLIQAFNYAKEAGAKIINCSWGTTYDEGEAYNFSQTYLNTLADLKAAGINIVFAAGNSSLDLDTNWGDESELDSVIGVGATSVLNDVTDYSNYGSSLDIIAPGGGGTSNNNNLLGILSIDLYGEPGDEQTLGLVDDSYGFTSGTSFAAPTTSGVIALMLSVNPNLTPEQIRQILINTADKVGGANANYDINGFDTYRAYGKLNAGAAIQAAINAI